MRTLASLAFFAAIGLGLVACGSDDDGGSGGPSGNGGSGNGGGSGGSGNGAGTGGSGGGTGGGTPVIPDEHPRIYLNAANKARLQGLLDANDPAATRFRDMVENQLGGGDVYAYESWYSALMGQLTDDPKYCADAIQRVDEWVTGEEAKIAGGENADVAGDSYLEVGPIIGGAMITFDWCYDTLTADQKTRWIAYANQAVWNVWHPSEAQWNGTVHDWSGWSIDNPSNNYYYSFLKATVLTGLATKGENPDADGWIDKFRTEKIGNQLVPTFHSDLEGGGSREGTGYGVAMKGLFWLYDIWEASTTERIADLTTHTRSSLAYLMHETVPTLDRVAPIGDHARDSTAALFDYHREYGAALAWLYRTDDLAKPMRTWLDDNSVPEMSQGFEYVFDFMYRDPEGAKDPLSVLATTYFGSGTGHLFARSSWDTNATWIGFSMGPYTESHAHHDQLSFLLYKDSWLAYDGNVETHSGIFQGETAHNLVRMEKGGNVLSQHEGHSSTVLALADSAEFLYAAGDATAVYDGEGVNLVQREIVYLKPDILVVYDRVDAGSGATHVWQLNSPVVPSPSGSSATLGGLVLHAVKPSGATFSVVDLPDEDPDFQGGHRLDRTVSGNGAVYFLNVLSVDGAVTAASDASQGSDDGVSIALAAGGTATVRFHQGSPGGALTYGSFDGALPSGVTPPPLFVP
jgi:hypothetical protein